MSIYEGANNCPLKNRGGNGRCNAFRNYLVSRGFTVDTICFPGNYFSSQLWYYYQHGLSLVMGHEMRNIRKTADRLEKIIKTQNMMQ
jgi:hypothetical protein